MSKKSLHFYFLLVFISFTLQPLIGQISFTNSNSLLSNSDFHSGVAIAVADMNNDGLDDIVRMDEGYQLNIEFQSTDGSVFENIYIGDMEGGSQWSMCVADVNNDGFNDVIAGGSYDNVKLTKRMPDGSYQINNLPNSNMFLQGSNLADINNDGWLDVYACHDDAESKIWGNDGTGNFFGADEWIDGSTNPVSDNSGNYGSVWTDFDNDGDLDLYIAKCRQGVNDSTDPRRINMLLVNDGNNNYTEMGEEFGLRIGKQSWTADFGDIDNDGDMDCFITNHDAASQILLNDGTGHFTDITDDTGLNVSVLPIQGIFQDFDNDGFLDIIVGGSGEELWHNNGDNTFTQINNAFIGSSGFESYAVGDLNNDGFVDVYAGYAGIYTNPSNIDDVLWLNATNDNNWLTIRPIGIVSNKAAVGARIEIYGEWGVQIRDIRAGESYGISNSLNAHFGIGSSTGIDQLVIKWPSGIISVIDNPNINEVLTVPEEGCILSGVEITPDGTTTICPGEAVTLSAPAGGTYLWSTDETTQSIQASEAATYTVFMTDEEGCIGSSNAITITVNPDNTPSVEVIGNTAFCEGGTVILSSTEAGSYLWSTGETSQSIEVSISENYSVTVPGLCQNFSSVPLALELDIYTPLAPTAVGATLFAPGSATLSSTGEQPSWYDVAEGGMTLGTGNIFTTPEIAETTSFYVESLESFAGQAYNVGMTEHSGNSNYGGNQFNGEILFDALAPFLLKRARVYTDTPGSRTVEVRDANGVVLSSVVVNIPVGEHIIDLDLEVPTGNGLVLSTNEDDNNSTFGYNSPRLQRNNTNTDYPYSIEDIVSLNASNFGTDWYYYFYDWEIEEEAIMCLSPRTEVVAVVETSTIFDVDKIKNILLSPNPTSGLVSFNLPENSTSSATIQLFDVTGKLVFTKKSAVNTTTHSIDMQTYADGIYWIKVLIDQDVFAGKLIKTGSK